jgi:hypothetical protein
MGPHIMRTIQIQKNRFRLARKKKGVPASTTGFLRWTLFSRRRPFAAIGVVIVDMKVMHMDVQIDNSRDLTVDQPPRRRVPQLVSQTSRGSTRGSWLVQRWSRKVFRLPLYAQLCTLQLPQFSSLGLCSGWDTLLTSIVLGAVVLQTYITASFVLEACAGLKLDLYQTNGPCSVSRGGTA